MSVLQRLEPPNLDNLRFQRDLVDEARKRIIQYCPEWTDYNLSDPGITLIELFAWMTEAIIYRLNQVPQKNYIEFLRMLDVQLHPACAAQTELTFYLSAPFPLRPNEPELTPEAKVEKGLRVSYSVGGSSEEIIFTTDEELRIDPPLLEQIRTDVAFTQNHYEPGVARQFDAFHNVPRLGDAFYLGFANDISGNVLRLHFSCQREASGIVRAMPPLRWSCYMGKDANDAEDWQPITLGTGDERDTTGGFRNEEGHLTLYLPLDMPDLPLRGIGPETLTLPARTSSTPPPHQREGAYWLRCQYVQDPDKPEVRYTETPVIRRVRAEVLGSTVRATNAVFVTDEEVGVSSGDPGQTFKLKQERILDLIGDEQVQVEERHNGELTFKEWQRVHTFCESERHDRHYMLDTDRGEIIFGPAIRQVDGTVRQYGCVPGVGRHVR
ncbi:MAG: putative baseplate assembly protein, partial [Caldilineaceae bacterium]|nr:putative baseplate assembly protein [Caldilineaceae bacterium]